MLKQAVGTAAAAEDVGEDTPVDSAAPVAADSPAHTAADSPVVVEDIVNTHRSVASTAMAQEDTGAVTVGDLGEVM